MKRLQSSSSLIVEKLPGAQDTRIGWGFTVYHCPKLRTGYFINKQKIHKWFGTPNKDCAESICRNFSRVLDPSGHVLSELRFEKDENVANNHWNLPWPFSYICESGRPWDPTWSALTRWQWHRELKIEYTGRSEYKWNWMASRNLFLLARNTIVYLVQYLVSFHPLRNLKVISAGRKRG